MVCGIKFISFFVLFAAYGVNSENVGVNGGTPGSPTEFGPFQFDYR